MRYEVRVVVDVHACVCVSVCVCVYVCVACILTRNPYTLISISFISKPIGLLWRSVVLYSCHGIWTARDSIAD